MVSRQYALGCRTIVSCGVNTLTSQKISAVAIKAQVGRFVSARAHLQCVCRVAKLVYIDALSCQGRPQ